MEIYHSIEKWLLDPTIRKIMGAIFGVLFILVFIRLSRKSVNRFVKGSQTRYRLRKFFTFLGYFIIFLFLASVFSDRLGKLGVIFGVIGAGVAFALQEVIASLGGWVAVTSGNFYEVGDRVQLGGIVGDVVDIGVLRTTLMECGQWVKGDLYNGRIVRVANSFVFKEPVFNYSADFPFLWDEITLPIKYGSDLKLARSIMENVVQDAVGHYIQEAQTRWHRMVNKFAIENAQIEPMVTLVANDNWAEFTVRYVVDYKKRRITKDILFTKILEEIQKTDGKVTLSSTTLSIV